MSSILSMLPGREAALTSGETVVVGTEVVAEVTGVAMDAENVGTMAEEFDAEVVLLIGGGTAAVGTGGVALDGRYCARTGPG